MFYRRRKNNRQRAALQNDLRSCLDADGRYYKQQSQYRLLVKSNQSTADGQPYQGFAASGRTRNYGPALPPPPPPSCLLATDQYAAYTPVDAAGSLLGAAHPTSGAVPISGGRISTGSDVTNHVTSAGGGWRPYPATQPVEHIYESPKFVRRGDGEDDDYDDDVIGGDTGNGMICRTSRQMVLGGTSSAVVTTFQ